MQKIQTGKGLSRPNYNLEKFRNQILNKKYGKLTVIGFEKISNQWKVVCLCDCGNKKICFPYQLKNNSIKSCGCQKIQNIKIARSKLRKNEDCRTKHDLYGTWRQMINRCENPSTNHYDRYGGRGIKVCEEWHDFWNFVSWSESVGGRPVGYTLDRIDNNGNYFPSNCRWASRSVQSLNTSSNRYIELNGCRKTIHEWSVCTGLHEQTITNRLNRGWTVEKVLDKKLYSGNNQYNKN